MDRDEARKIIDEADSAIVSAFAARMDACREIAKWKAEHHAPVRDEAREKEKIRRVTEEAPAAYREYMPALYELLFEMSREMQEKLIAGENGGIR